METLFKLIFLGVFIVAAMGTVDLRANASPNPEYSEITAVTEATDNQKSEDTVTFTRSDDRWSDNHWLAQAQPSKTADTDNDWQSEANKALDDSGWEKHGYDALK